MSFLARLILRLRFHRDLARSRRKGEPSLLRMGKTFHQALRRDDDK